MELVEADGEVGPTDKNYKAYLRWDGGEAKFYYQHLSPEQMIRFVELLNQKKLKIGYPGRFYVIPYFITLKNQEPPSDG